MSGIRPSQWSSVQVRTQRAQPRISGWDDRRTAAAPRAQAEPARVWSDVKDTGNRIARYDTDVPRAFLLPPARQPHKSAPVRAPMTAKQMNHEAKQVAAELSRALGERVAPNDSRVGMVLRSR